MKDTRLSQNGQIIDMSDITAMYFVAFRSTIRTDTILKRTMRINVYDVVNNVYTFYLQFWFRIEIRKTNLIIVNVSEGFASAVFLLFL